MKIGTNIQSFQQTPKEQQSKLLLPAREGIKETAVCMLLQDNVLLLKDSTVKLAVKAGIEFIFRMKISTCKT